MVKRGHPYLNTQFHDQSRLVSVVPCSLVLTSIVTWLLKYRPDVVWWNQIINIPSKHFHPHQTSDGEDKLRGLPTKSTKACCSGRNPRNPDRPPIEIEEAIRTLKPQQLGPLARMRCLLAFTWTHYKVVSSQNSAPSTLQEALQSIRKMEKWHMMLFLMSK